jgi:hypothetical protein
MADIKFSTFSYLSLKGCNNEFSAEKALGENLINKTIVRDELHNNYLVFDSENDMWDHYKSVKAKHWHEVIINKKLQRLKFDIDAKAEEINDIDNIILGTSNNCDEKALAVLNLIIDKIIFTFNNTYSDKIDRSFLLVTNSSGQDINKSYKYSYHILIIPYGVIYAEECRNLTDTVKSSLESKVSAVIDNSINKPSQNFRLLGSSKADSVRIKRIDNNLAEMLGTCKVDDPTNYVLVCNKGLKTMPSLLKTSDIKYSYEFNIETVNKVIELLTEKGLIDSFTYSNFTNNIITFRRKCPSMCPVHEKVHENDNMFVTIHNNERGKNVYYNCYRKYEKNASSSMFVGVIDEIKYEVDKIELDTHITRRIKDIKDGNINAHDSLKSKFEFLPANQVNIYNKSSLDPYEYRPTLIVSAQMKMGKTKTLKKYIEEYFPESIIDNSVIRFMSARMTFSSSLLNEFSDFTLYNTIDEHIINASRFPRVIVQVESLHRLSERDDVDLLILDEVESILEQFNSPLHKNLIKTFAIFEKLMRDAKYVICMDANISDRTYNIIKTMRSNHEIYFHQNRFSKAKDDKYFFTSSMYTWYNKLETFLPTKKRIVIPTNSLKEAENCQLLIEKYCTAHKIEKKIMIYTSKTTAGIKADHFGNVKKYWCDYDIIIYTPTLSAGVSFEEAHFDVLFGYFNDCSCTVESCRQMLGRVRNLKDKEHYICLTSIKGSYSLPTDINLMKDIIYSNRSTLLSDKVLNPPCFMSYSEKGELSYYESPYSKIWFENVKMENISKNNFIMRFIDQIADSGAEISNLENVFINDDKYGYLYTQRASASEEIMAERARNIAKAEDKDKSFIDDISQRIQLQMDVSDAERNTKDKYYFKDAYNWHDKHVTEEFVATYNKESVKTIFRNLNEIKRCTTIEESLLFMKNSELNYYKKAQSDPEFESTDLQSSKVKYRYHKHALAQYFLLSSNLSMNDRKHVHITDLYLRYCALASYIENYGNKKVITDIIGKNYNCTSLYKKSGDSDESKEKFINYILKFVVNPLLRMMYGLNIVKCKNDKFYELKNDKNGDLFILSDHCPIIMSKLTECYTDYRIFDRFYYDLTRCQFLLGD